MNKGVLWGFWADAARARGVIVVNTHMKAGPPACVKAAQFRELADLVRALRRRFAGAVGRLEVVVAGDFNCAPQNADLQAWRRGAGLELVSDPALATHRRGFVLDMVFWAAGARDGDGEGDGGGDGDGGTEPAVSWAASVCQSPGLSDHHMVCVQRRQQQKHEAR